MGLLKAFHISFLLPVNLLRSDKFSWWSDLIAWSHRGPIFSLSYITGSIYWLSALILSTPDCLEGREIIFLMQICPRKPLMFCCCPATLVRPMKPYSSPPFLNLTIPYSCSLSCYPSSSSRWYQLHLLPEWKIHSNVTCHWSWSQWSTYILMDQIKKLCWSMVTAWERNLGKQCLHTPILSILKSHNPYTISFKRGYAPKCKWPDPTYQSSNYFSLPCGVH